MNDAVCGPPPPLPGSGLRLMMQRKCWTHLPIAGSGFHAPVLAIRNASFCCPISLFPVISRLIKPRPRRFIDRITTFYRHIIALNLPAYSPRLSPICRLDFSTTSGSRSFTAYTAWPNTRPRYGGLGLPSMGQERIDGLAVTHSAACVCWVRCRVEHSSCRACARPRPCTCTSSI